MIRLAATWLAMALSIPACTTPSEPPIIGASFPDDSVIYVIERGWHTDIGLPVGEIMTPLAALERPFTGVRFLTFGFGERQFLLARQVTLGGMLTALLPSRSALLMTALRAAPEAAFGHQHVVALHVSRAGLARLEARLWQEIEKRPAGEPMLLTNGPYPGSVFYAARGTYDAFHTCNTWTAAMLHSAGLPVPTAGVLFVGQVMGNARRIGAQQASGRDG